MTETDEGVQVCQECGKPLVPQATEDVPEASYDGPHGSATVDIQFQDVCVNEDCSRFGKPNDPLETTS